MTTIDIDGIEIADYKSFGADGSGSFALKNINVIIGRNNSGKSALVDAIAMLCENFTRTSASPPLRQASILLNRKASESDIRRIFRDDTTGGTIRGNHWHAVGKRLVDAKLTVRLERNSLVFHNIVPIGDFPDLANHQKMLSGLTFGNPFQGKHFRRLSAERDVLPEEVPHGDLPAIGSKGAGLTTAIAMILNLARHNSDIVEVSILGALNRIFGPDAQFRAIHIHQHDSGVWEIFLNEERKGRIALSDSGSGLKTVLLVIAFFELIPYIEKSQLQSYIFAFEELENNLHPSIQRRLLGYIRDNAVEHGTLCVMTTHSSIAIDYFASDVEAQILHVVHDGSSSKVNTVSTYVEHHGILDDLDVRASDILQANCIVWVEGPSDRLYFNRWMELWTGGTISEGTHYQCVFYGGRLLAHLSASEPELDASQVVKILRVNRRAIVLIDSDKSTLRTPLNSTKQRIVREFDSFGGISWVTKGREIENYIPPSAIRSVVPKFPEEGIGQFDDIVDALERISAGEKKRFERSKALFAEKVIPQINLAEAKEMLDLNERMVKVISAVSGWYSR